MSNPQGDQPAVPTGPAPGSAPTEATPPPHPERKEPQEPREPAAARGGRDSASRRDSDPLRGSRASGIWVAVLALIVVIVLLSVFVAQNTQTVQVAFFGWSGSAPLSATLLISVAGGALLVATAGALRILQLRHRVKKARKQHR